MGPRGIGSFPRSEPVQLLAVAGKAPLGIKYLLQSLSEPLSLIPWQRVPAGRVEVKPAIGTAVLRHVLNKLCIAKGKDIVSGCFLCEFEGDHVVVTKSKRKASFDCSPLCIPLFSDTEKGYLPNERHVAVHAFRLVDSKEAARAALERASQALHTKKCRGNTTTHSEVVRCIVKGKVPDPVLEPNIADKPDRDMMQSTNCLR